MDILSSIWSKNSSAGGFLPLILEIETVLLLLETFHFSACMSMQSPDHQLFSWAQLFFSLQCLSIQFIIERELVLFWTLFSKSQSPFAQHTFLLPQLLYFALFPKLIFFFFFPVRLTRSVWSPEDWQYLTWNNDIPEFEEEEKVLVLTLCSQLSHFWMKSHCCCSCERGGSPRRF